MNNTVQTDIYDGTIGNIRQVDIYHTCSNDGELKKIESKINTELTDEEEKKNDFYKNAEKYWSEVPPTINGMLGGFSIISKLDIDASEKFLNEICRLKLHPGTNYALDCGAGIGRVTKNLLIPRFKKVDIVEQDKHFAEHARAFIASDTNLGNIYNIGLQDFSPEEQKYDVVWCQWVLGHLIDHDLVEFFKRIGKSLVKNGLLILKENVTSSNNVEVDDVDSSVTRPLALYKTLIKASNYKIIKMIRQTNFPKELYPVYMIACKKQNG